MRFVPVFFPLYHFVFPIHPLLLRSRSSAVCDALSAPVSAFASPPPPSLHLSPCLRRQCSCACSSRVFCSWIALMCMLSTPTTSLTL